jgi:hypothetical protein
MLGELPARAIGYVPVVAAQPMIDVEELLLQLIADVQALVDEGVLNNGQGNALIVKLLAALNQWGQGNVTAMIGQLGAFINNVEAFMNARILTESQGQPLIDAANQIIDLLRPRERVIGFGYLSDILLDGNAAQFSVIKRADRVAPENASAALVRPLDSSYTDDDQIDPDLTSLLDRHRNLLHPLLAPALLR